MYLSFPVYVSLQGKYKWELFVMRPWGTADWRASWEAGGSETCKILLKYEELLETEEINYSEGLKCHYSFK